MKIYHIVKIHFDRRREGIDQDWLNARYKFFRENTLKSLRQQTFQGFSLWFCCDDGMPGMVDGISGIDPFGGAAFTFLSTRPRPGQHYTFSKDLAPIDKANLEESDYVYITRIDSDDLYSCDALEIANDCRPLLSGRVESSIFARGYMYDMISNRVGVYVNPSGPFHTLMIPTKTFIDEEAYNKLDIGDHSVVRARWPAQVLPDWKFTVLIHGKNFISDFDYGREQGVIIEKNWTVDHWIKQPVTFDLDDFCDDYGNETLKCLDMLKERYPLFKCTLFTIPTKTGQALIERAKARDWIELAVHGVTHTPNEELKNLDSQHLFEYLVNNPLPDYVKGFRAPGWYITDNHIRALSKLGFWVGIHKRDVKDLAHLCTSGFYYCDEAKPYWHGHVHDTCGNYVRKDLPMLLRRWRQDQQFCFVSESILKVGS